MDFPRAFDSKKVSFIWDGFCVVLPGGEWGTGCVRGYRRGRAGKEIKASLLPTLGLSAYSSADIGMGPIIVPASPGWLQLPRAY